MAYLKYKCSKCSRKINQTAFGTRLCFPCYDEEISKMNIPLTGV